MFKQKKSINVEQKAVKIKKKYQHSLPTRVVKDD